MNDDEMKKTLENKFKELKPTPFDEVERARMRLGYDMTCVKMYPGDEPIVEMAGGYVRIHYMSQERSAHILLESRLTQADHIKTQAGVYVSPDLRYVLQQTPPDLSNLDWIVNIPTTRSGTENINVGSLASLGLTYQTFISCEGNHNVAANTAAQSGHFRKRHVMTELRTKSNNCTGNQNDEEEYLKLRKAEDFVWNHAYNNQGSDKDPRIIAYLRHELGIPSEKTVHPKIQGGFVDLQYDGNGPFINVFGVSGTFGRPNYQEAVDLLNSIGLRAVIDESRLEFRYQ